ncbi:MAG: DUF4476 domain-containing protein [Chitinophagaceae bacterium]
MKKIFTLGLAIITSMIAFAGFAPSRLIVSAEGSAAIQVTVDENRFDQPLNGSSVVVTNLQPGFHSVKIFQLTEKRYGIFGKRQTTGYRLVYNTTINIKPLFATTIELSRFGNAQIKEEPLRGVYNNRAWNKGDRRNDTRGYGDDDRMRTDNNGRNYGYSNNNEYARTISDEDFFAAGRVMQRESFDDARLLYAKVLLDENYLDAEQVKELARFFSFDNNRLEFAKYAYGKTTDKNNFSVVCNAFSSTNGRAQLLSFIKNYR